MPHGEPRCASHPARRRSDPPTVLAHRTHRSVAAARVTDKCLCVGPPDVIVKGSTTVLVSSLLAAPSWIGRAHGGMIVLGDFTVLIGG